MVGNTPEAEDIVSEAFEKAMLNIDKYEYKGYSFGAWLYRIARNIVYDRSKLNKTTSLDAIEPFIKSNVKGPEDVAQDEEEIEQLHKMLANVKAEQREVLMLRYVEGYSIKEVTDILDKTEDSIKSLAKRGLKALKQSALEN
jgi:RNA polymerase sigma-70 factor (ECF subfamily)